MPGVSELVVADGDGIAVNVHVQPRAGRTALVGTHGDALKLRVAAPPVDDRANRAVAELLAEVLGVKAQKVELVTGDRTRVKRFRVGGIERDDAVQRLERALEDATSPRGPRARRAR
jgi:uncharacterized protein (TIGR00251 family)